MNGRVGVVHLPQWPAAGLPAFARRAEAQGYDELWLWEDCFLTGGLTTAAAALASTERLAVGSGLLPATVRNPVIAAMEIGGLANMFPGRHRVAFGHGVEAWMHQIGARPPDRLVALEEVVGAVRALLAGRELTVAGRHVRLDRVRLDHPPDDPPPVLIGTTGRRGAEIAGRVADGVLLPEGSGPAAVRWARSAAGPVTVYAWLSLDDDADRALSVLRPRVERWRAAGGYRRLAELAGIADGPLDDARLRDLAVVGDPAGCARAVRRLWDAGADSVVLVSEDAGALERFAADVLAAGLR